MANATLKTSRGSMKPFYEIADRLMNSKKTFQDIFELSAKLDIRNKNTEVFIYEKDGKKKSLKYKNYYKEVIKYASQIAQELSDIEKGSYIAFKVNNNIHWPLGFWGLLAAGFKPLLINPILTQEDTEKLIKEANAKAIIIDDQKTYKTKSINISSLDFKHVGFKPSWANEMAVCTSGTTGESRIFVYDGEAMSHQIYAAYTMPNTTADVMYIGKVRLLAMIPFSHIFGFVAVFLWYTFFGTTLVFPNSNNPSDLQKACVKYRCSHIYSVPLFWDTIAKKFLLSAKQEKESKQKLIQKMLAYNNGFITKYEAGLASKRFIQKIVQKKILGDQVTFCIAGGSYLSKNTLETINGLGYHLYNGYGMTEIGITSVELSPLVKQRNKGSVGKPLFDVEYKIKNEELCVKSKYIHTKRIIDGEEFPRDIDEDGYFHTGDIASIDDDGYTYIKGKIKDVVIGSNGENIYPDEIESKFKSLQNVNNLAVLGVKSDKGELLTLILEVKDGFTKDDIANLENQIKEINESIPLSMQIKDSFISKYPLPLNASMKIKKFALKSDFENNKENYLHLSNGIKINFDGYDKGEVDQIVGKLLDILAYELNLDKNSIAPNNHIIIDLGGDSFSYMAIIAEIETTFNIQISSEMVGKLNSANQFALYILQNRK